MANRLVGHGLPPRRVKRALMLLRQQIRGERPLSGVQLFAEGSKLLASDGHVLWEPESGQQRLRFDGPDGDEGGEGKSAVLGRPAANPPAAKKDTVAPQTTSVAVDISSALPTTADGWFDLALQLEELEPHRAYEAYLKALEVDPEYVEAYINIGRLCSAAGELDRAAAYFRQALRVDATHPVAHFNLAVTLHDLGELETAAAAYRAALAQDPYFADAHYNLAALFEQMGDSEGAHRHRRLYETALQQPSS